MIAYEPNIMNQLSKVQSSTLLKVVFLPDKRFFCYNSTDKLSYEMIQSSKVNENNILSSAALYIVPGSFGWGSAVLAAITTLAPSFAAFSAIALPIPRDAPVMKSVRPANFLILTIIYEEAIRNQER